MVTRIRTGKSIKGAVNYNEHKVIEGKATLIMAHGYSKDINDLKFSDKLNRLQKLATLNERATTNCLHVSLNFDPSEKLTKEKLQEIAKAYMDKIGFGNQPYLVYEHTDAGHQHVHIVTTNIQKDGKRISMHNLGKGPSEKARKEIEIEFGLKKAGDHQKKQVEPLKQPDLQKALYGKVETKRTISNIVTQVVGQYKYTSLAELNAVLKQFNVLADRGAPDTRMFEKNGLQYSLLDENGNKIGIPVKASSIYGKPILKELEKKIEENGKAREPFKEGIKNTIGTILSNNQALSRDSFAKELESHGIAVVYRENEEGLIYGVTYVDHKTKTVFNGSDLGKEYSAGALRGKFAENNSPTLPNKQDKKTLPFHKPNNEEKSEYAFAVSKEIMIKDTIQSKDIINDVTQPENPLSYVPWQLKKKRKQKRKQSL